MPSSVDFDYERMKGLKDEIVVVGVGDTDYSKLYKPDAYVNNAYGYCNEAFKKALNDAGLKRDRIDGLAVHRDPSHMRMAEILGINPRWTLQLWPGGRWSGASILDAVNALHTGVCTCVALMYGNNGRSVRVTYGGENEVGFFGPWGITSPGAHWGMLWRKFMHEYDVDTMPLARIAVSTRKKAALNPQAVMKKPITIEDHQSARYIADPLRLLDYCLINDGGVCMILTTADMAKKLKTRKPPVYISGIGRSENFVNQSASMGLFTWDYGWPRHEQVANQSYSMAGVNRGDIDCLQIYDNFTVNVALTLQGLGYCQKGKIDQFLESGAIELGGKIPVNTSGSHLSESYMQGWGLNVEAVRQLRGECGERQVDNCKYAHFILNTATMTSIIYRRD